MQLDGGDSLASSSTISISDNELTFNYSSAPDDSFISRASVLSEESEGTCGEQQQISVVTGVTTHQWDCSPPVWYEQHQKRPATLPSSRQTVRRDNRLLVGSELPSFSAPNCRSIAPKLRNFAEDMKMRSITVALCSESWEQASNKKFQKEVERLLEVEGLKMVSNPRKYRRGGGVCIVADLTKVDIQPLDIPNPNNLEVVFAIVTPKNGGIIKKIITFALYSPPRSKRK